MSECCDCHKQREIMDIVGSTLRRFVSILFTRPFCFIVPKTLFIWLPNLSILSLPDDGYSRIVHTKFDIYVSLQLKTLSIVLHVLLRFATSHYPFGVSKLFFLANFATLITYWVIMTYTRLLRHVMVYLVMLPFRSFFLVSNSFN